MLRSRILDSCYVAGLALAAGVAPTLSAQKPAKPAAPDTSSDTASVDSLQWLGIRNLGPTVAGGRVAAVTGVPGNPNIYYVGPSAGGVFKTLDGGITWKAVFDKEPEASIGAIALAPNNPNIVWVGTGEGNIRNDVVNGHGVYLSTDAGQSWHFMGLKDAGQISRIVIDPNNSDRVFVAAIGNAWKPNADRGVFRTTDGGHTWKKVLFVNDTTGTGDLVMEPGNPSVLFAGMWQVRRFPWNLENGGKGSGLWRSTDGGDTWTRLHEGLPDGPYGRIALGTSRSDPTHIYAIVEAKSGLLWETHDLGDHWSSVSGNHALDVRPFYFSRIDVSPSDDRRVYFSSFQLMESRDGGHTAHEIDGSVVHPDHHALWIDPTDGNRMIQGNDGGVYVSHDAGQSWRYLNNLPIGQFYMVAADSRQPFRLCGGLQDNNAWCGPSNNLVEGDGSGAEWYTVTGGDGEYAVPAPSDSNVVYVDSQNGFVTRLDLATGVSRLIRPYMPGVEMMNPSSLKYRFNWTSPIAVSATNANEVFLGGNVLFKSTDGGAHWAEISPDVTRNDKSKQVTSGGKIEYDISGAETYNTILTITIAPTDTNVIWLGTDDGNVQVTKDGGRTWTNVRPKAKGLPDEGRVYQVGVSPFDAGTAYITLDYHEFGDDTPYVFMTRDYGATWTSVAHGLPAYAAHVVREDPAQKGFLLLGTDNGLWYSRDAGSTWKSMASAFPTSPVLDIQFIKNTRSVAIATHGRGLFVIDDIAPLEMLTPQIASSAFHVFDVAPAALWHANEYGGSPASAYHAPSLDRAAMIRYWLHRKTEATAAQKARHEGPVRIVILDSKGDTVYTANGTGKAGMNTYEWRLGYHGPTKLVIAPQGEGQSDSNDGGPGPDVLPGTYTAVVTADTQTVRRTIEVRTDPHLSFDVAAAREQLTTALAMRDQITVANGILNGLHNLRRQLAGVDSTAIAMSPNGMPGDTTVMHAAHQLDEKAKALMDTLWNPTLQREAPEDDIHYLQSFYDRLVGTGFGVQFVFDQAPSDPVKEELTAVKSLLATYKAKYDALLKTDVPTFNAVAEKAGVPGVRL
ncbi:MAG TPA: hypothetical protein VIC24_07715 [Gemmatimonadaceae bacterium]|jgi:photosystem II stability/assembly factor-like uncharacterized protein